MIIRFLIIAAFLSVLSITDIYAQDSPGTGSVTVFSEDGTTFTLYLNGDRKNSSPATRVVADNITEAPVSFRIVFENSVRPEIKKNGIRQGKNCLYVIHKNKKGEYALRPAGCDDSVETVTEPVTQPMAPATGSYEAPAQLSATFANDIISLNDGRTLTVKKVKVSSMTYPKVIFTALQGAKVSLKYDNGNESYSAEAPMEYEVTDFQNNNAYFTLTVDEGGPAKTWHVKLKNNNGYDLKIE